MDEIDADALTYREFCEQYVARNRPVLIRNVVSKWFSATAQWKIVGSSGIETINFEFLRKHYGHHTVPIVDGDSVEYGVQDHKTMGFSQYLDDMQCHRTGKRYLKDWHFVNAEKLNPPVYTTPEYFEDDWLNWWWDHKDEQADDYRFVYIGPAGSWTPMHHDVFRSYSWSVNIVGCKEWIFFHPEDEWRLQDKYGRSVIPDVTASDYDRDLYPHVHKATGIRVVQTTGDAIFVPSGWYHQVKNVEATISINHNWFNGYNICEIWRFLTQEYTAVEKELSHLREIGLDGDEFQDQCQLVMRANAGMNYVEFRELLRAKSVDLMRQGEESETLVDDWRRLAVHDHLDKIAGILTDLDEYFHDTDEVLGTDAFMQVQANIPCTSGS